MNCSEKYSSIVYDFTRYNLANFDFQVFILVKACHILFISHLGIWKYAISFLGIIHRARGLSFIYKMLIWYFAKGGNYGSVELNGRSTVALIHLIEQTITPKQCFLKGNFELYSKVSLLFLKTFKKELFT